MKTKFNALYEAIVNEVDLPDDIANWIINSLTFYKGNDQSPRTIKIPQDYSKNELEYLKNEIYPEFGHLTVLSKSDKNKIYLRMKQRFDLNYLNYKKKLALVSYNKQQAKINLGLNDIEGVKAYIKYRMLPKAMVRAKNPKSPKQFNITLEDVLKDRPQDNRCPILGYVLEKGSKKAGPDSPSLDRVDSKEGYTPNNIAVISYNANALKNNGTWQELKRIVDYINGKI